MTQLIDLLKKYNLLEVTGRHGWVAYETTESWLASYLDFFHKEDIKELHRDVKLALNNEFEKIEDPDWSVGLGSHWYAEITVDSFILGKDLQNREMIPLEDFHQILKVLTDQY